MQDFISRNLIIGNSSAMSGYTVSAWMLAHKADAVYPGMSGTPIQPQTGDAMQRILSEVCMAELLR